MDGLFSVSNKFYKYYEKIYNRLIIFLQSDEHNYYAFETPSHSVSLEVLVSKTMLRVDKLNIQKEFSESNPKIITISEKELDFYLTQFNGFFRNIVFIVIDKRNGKWIKSQIYKNGFNIKCINQNESLIDKR